MLNLVYSLAEMCCLAAGVSLAFFGMWLQAVFFLVFASYFAVLLTSKVTNLNFVLPSKDLADKVLKSLEQTNKGE